MIGFPPPAFQQFGAVTTEKALSRRLEVAGIRHGTPQLPLDSIPAEVFRRAVGWETTSSPLPRPLRNPSYRAEYL